MWVEAQPNTLLVIPARGQIARRMVGLRLSPITLSTVKHITVIEIGWKVVMPIV